MFVAMTASAVVVAPSARVDGASPATTATSF
ncbi:MAG: hypothetical protein JWL72_4035, partial [Ilumatobacteraceae bacterium]|nr:hypothetical protein [Ilumatobacteraceae bacterium]